MEFTENIKKFSERVSSLKDVIKTEESTKISLVIPLFQILGYDVFNPEEFCPEYTADVGNKKGEKVDYSIIINDEPVMLIEVKAANMELTPKHINQLLRYFTVTKAKFGILTNGIIYQFFSDLEENNKMDTVPFLEINLCNMRKESIEELKRFQKEAFSMKTILDSASDLKYLSMVKNVISEQFNAPSEQFVKAIINRNIYSGTKTQAVLDKFKGIIKKAFQEYINDIIAERISTNIVSTESIIYSIPKEKEDVLLPEEIEILDFIKTMLPETERILYKKTSRYIYMQVGELTTKWLCRIYLRKNQHFFVLHKFENTDYECEYYFDKVKQLDLIRDIIIDTYNKCCRL